MKKEEEKKESGVCGCLTIILLAILIGALIANPAVTLILILIAVITGFIVTSK